MVKKIVDDDDEIDDEEEEEDYEEEEEEEEEEGDDGEDIKPVKSNRNHINKKMKMENESPKKKQSKQRTAASTSPFTSDSTNEDDANVELKAVERYKAELEMKNKAAAEVGIIQSVVVQNFMCHRYLEITLGPHVNFITGENGSGKSAILCAIVVGLGGKAANTGRGASTKSLIKVGESFALIQIRLKNQGPDAYKPDIYSDIILIERRLVPEGAGGYKLKNGRTNTIVSTRKEELDNILDAFAIQVENPFAVLNQEVSREFLSNASPASMYSYFMKATELEKLSSDYKQIITFKVDIDVTLEHKKTTMKRMKDEITALKARYDDLKEIHTLGVRISELKKELTWAFVREEELKGLKIESELSKQQAALATLEDHLKQLVAVESSAMQELKRIEGIMANSSHISLEITNRLQDKRKERDVARKKVAECNQKIQNIKETASRLESQLKSIESKINEKLKRISQNSSEKNKQTRARIERLIHDRDNFDAAITQSKNEAQMLEDRRRALIADNQNDKMDLEQISKRIYQVNKNLSTAKEAQKDKIKAFGPQMGTVLAEIKKEKRWVKEPVGPIGFFMELKDQKWAKAVESCIKELTTAFAVHNFDDQKRLSDIFKRTLGGSKFPLIIVRSFSDKIFEVRDLPDKRYTSILDVVRTDNVMVINTLIDQYQIHKVLLFENSKDATRVMFSDKQFPENVIRGFDIEGNTYEGGRSTAQYVNKWTGNLKLVASSDEQINSLQRQLEQLQTEKVKLEEAKRGVDKEANKISDSIKEIQNHIRAESMKVQRLTHEIKELQNGLREEESNVDILALERSKQSVEEEIQTARNEIASAQEQLVREKEPQDILEQEYAALQKESAKLIQDTEELDTQVNEAQKRVADASFKVKNVLKKKQDVDVAIENLKTNLSVSQQRTAELREKASQYCDPVETNRLPAAIDTEIKEKEKRVQLEERNRGKYDDVAKEYTEKLNLYSETSETFKNLKKVVQRLEEALEIRRKAFFDFRSSIAQRAKLIFVALLSQRGFEGKLIFNHKEGLLNIIVNPRSNSNEVIGVRKDTKSLSGGERSYSTICFLASLWEAIDSPFRVLDEFDVFMDQFNRKVSMKLLVNIATEEQSEKQHIFITPQSIDSTMTGSKIKIIVMKNPERNAV